MDFFSTFRSPSKLACEVFQLILGVNSCAYHLHFTKRTHPDLAGGLLPTGTSRGPRVVMSMLGRTGCCCGGGKIRRRGSKLQSHFTDCDQAMTGLKSGREKGCRTGDKLQSTSSKITYWLNGGVPTRENVPCCTLTYMYTFQLN